MAENPEDFHRLLLNSLANTPGTTNTLQECEAQKAIRQLQRNQLHIQKTIHLRGMRLEEAKEHLMQTVEQMLQTGARYALVIHGKGNRSLHKHAVIKHWLYEEADTDPRILACGPANEHDGGEGASYLVLGA